MSGSLAQTIMHRLETLGRISEEPGRLTRTFCSPAMRKANDLVGSWMLEAGMTVREDAIGNLIGHYAADKPGGRQPGSPPSLSFLIGSHLDTVRDAGKFDGPLGVLVGIACVQRLRDQNIRLPFAVEVIGFADEEGVRFQSTYLGSKVLAGTLDPRELKRTDANGVTMAEAIRQFGSDPDGIPRARVEPGRLLGYAEVHIEQGPVLEQSELSVGVVTAIAGQSRIKLRFTGSPGHTGTTPMALRRDALCAAAEFVLAVESFAQAQTGLVGTVGEILALPGASNVIPGEVRLSLDVRHAEDPKRQAAVLDLLTRAEHIAGKRSLKLDWELVHETAAVTCDPQLSSCLAEAMKRHQPELVELPSGAGHDAAVMAGITPAAMLFVRCKDGLSHHPDESASIKDVAVALEVMNDFLQLLARRS